MCGIAGIYSYQQRQMVDVATLRLMADLLAHRGPDDFGTHEEAFLGLAHRRLSIIDLSSGRQPLYNEDRSCALILNGELYNYLELRRDLEAAGHRFATQSDSEVLLHLYEERGEDCLEPIRGMFAFALWDAPRRRLLLGRDRLGQKPLYYADVGGRLLFASELRALLADPHLPRDLDARALDEFFTFQCIGAPRSVFRCIRKLPPAHLLVCDADGIRLRRYWQPRPDDPLDLQSPGSSETLQEELLELLRSAVHEQLMSEVPLGAFLSGGIDSSLVVALMAEALEAPVRTFSIGFEAEGYNELPFARQVAERWKTEHHEFVVKPDAVAILPKLVWYFSEPFGDASALPTYYVSELSRRHVTVVLTGDGGDEAFGGYDRYRAMRYASAVPEGLARIIASGLGFMRGEDRRFSLLSRLRRFAEAASRPANEQYLAMLSMLSAAWRQQIYTPEFLESLAEFSVVDERARELGAMEGDGLQRLMDFDTRTYLPNDVLVKVDIATMAHGLEARSPFLDHRVVEWAARLPWRMKIGATAGKVLLKRLAAAYVPAPILRRPKRGFGVPIAAWLRRELAEVARDVLLSEPCRTRGILRRQSVERLLDEHLHRRADHSPLLWNLLIFEQWCQTFLDRPLPVVVSHL